ncbi:DNA replication and repair protein RecF [Legionella massiliensis]|uniref:DNA replication and repair protein RecF n=1 Tax=Legionella massiliensis TaxID=1034943 RepID=A0A078KWQ4_9GAMM|nr:DNA replication/repair protein RecF [Legionella massiliensis]CDZ76163.1 DNA replication and repair protein RecF [Legionella massiliensis]CEE11901.1 DNA replication and repair protein RecF [Legionella massiliensis]
MTLAQLQIQNLRNIRSARYNFHPHLNLIIGANGSGKTSFLEAIYLLGSGHSFRTREISPLVSHDKDQLTVFARTNDEQSISIQKSLTSATQVRLNSYPCQTTSELAYFLPCQVFYQDLFQIIDAGPSVRRSLLDWGLFHVEPSYHNLLKEYKRALKQRNALLRQKAQLRYFEPWNKIISELALNLDNFRSGYFSQLQDEFKRILQQLTDIDCDIGYYKGWDRKGTNKELAKILIESHDSDLQRQYTHYGPHQADILIDSHHLKAKQFLSRGQQKIILIAIKLAQTVLMGKPCTFLFDDLTAELDNAHLDRLFELIFTLEGQFFITAINKDSIAIKLSQHPHLIFSLND